MAADDGLAAEVDDLCSEAEDLGAEADVLTECVGLTVFDADAEADVGAFDGGATDVDVTWVGVGVGRAGLVRGQPGGACTLCAPATDGLTTSQKMIASTAPVAARARMTAPPLRRSPQYVAVTLCRAMLRSPPRAR